MKRNSTRRLIFIAILSSVATVLMFFEIPLWFVPSFYEIDLSEIPVLIGGFAYGPVAGIIIEAVKIIVKTSIKGSSTMGVGEIANFLIGISFVVPASFIYYRNKTKKNAIVGLIVGSMAMVIMGSLLNAYMLLPAYAYFLSSSTTVYTVDSFVQMGMAVNPLIRNLFTFILFAVAPFNLIKGVLTSVIVILIYKRISILIKFRN